jgi:hypothetical protein
VAVSFIGGGNQLMVGILPRVLHFPSPIKLIGITEYAIYDHYNVTIISIYFGFPRRIF